MSGIANFSILTRPLNSPKLEEHPPNSSEYTFVASTINIALSILEHPTGRQHLTQLALAFDSSGRGRNHFGKKPNVARSWVDFFLTAIRSRFPVIIIDRQMINVNLLGTHPRGEWQGTLDQFNPRDQMVMINASRVDDMLAVSNSSQKANQQRFRTFQFLFATTFVHEVGGHLLVTFLGNGRPITPPQITGPNYGSVTNGESGRFLELNLFGGNTEYFHDATQDKGQTGIPYQIDSQGQAWRIHPNIINNVCQYNFQFPFTRYGPAVNPSTMRTLGRTSNDLPADPQNRNMLAQQSSLVGRLKNLPGYNVVVKDIVAIPMHPNRRLIAVKV